MALLQLVNTVLINDVHPIALIIPILTAGSFPFGNDISGQLDYE